VAELILFGLLVGVIIAAAIGPVGIATFVHAMAGQKYPALAGMGGCIAADMVLLAAAIFSAAWFEAYLVALPWAVYATIGLVLAAVGLYYLMGRRIPQPGGAVSFIVAFKITLFQSE
jgi:hypothetical protein